MNSRADPTPGGTPALTTPPDFSEFWAETLAELQATEIALEVADFARQPYKELRAARLRFTSLAGARLRGYALGWNDDRPRPLVIHAHGYGGRSAVQWLWGLSGLNILGFDVRGFGESFDSVQNRSPWGYMVTGIGSPRTSVLRGAVCDYARAVEAGTQLFGGRTRDLVFHGYSFSGALALMTEAVTQSAGLVAAGVPTFGWHEGRHRLVKRGSAVETRRYIEALPSERDRVMRTLSYFDSMNFAPFVQCPVIAGYGRMDDVVPPETVLAIFAHLDCPRWTMSLPVSHTDAPEEAAWEQFDAAWIDAALEGMPSDFGSEPGIQHLTYRQSRWGEPLVGAE